jgi:type II secretory pathway component PulC
MKERILLMLLMSIFMANFRLLYAQELDLPQRAKVEYNSGSLRDPFQNPQEKDIAAKAAAKKEKKEKAVLPAPSLAIQGIVFGGSFPQAIVESKVVKVGDTVKDAQIIKIEKDGITILYSGVEYKISSPAAQGGKNE